MTALGQTATTLVSDPLFGPIASVLSGLIAIFTLVRALRAVVEAPFRDLDARSKAVSYWAAWVQAQQIACSPEEFALAKSLAREKLNELAAEGRAQRAFETGRPKLQRIFLLDRPNRVAGWLSRLPFFLLLVLTLTCTVWTASVLWSEPTVSNLVKNTGFIVVLIALTAIARILAGRVERRRQATGERPI